MNTVAELVEIGPFFAGNTGPSLDFILTWDTGGYVDLTEADVQALIRRWDPRRKVPIGPAVTSGPCDIASAKGGEVTYEWTDGDPIDTVPIDPGWYYVQIEVTDNRGRLQLGQRAIFEVLPS